MESRKAPRKAFPNKQHKDFLPDPNAGIGGMIYVYACCFP